jgi:Ca2+/H+ antiporter, TMEM165/GDT1 family
MWEYGLVFVLAATPLVELVVVIPAGIGLGLQPALVAAVAAVGNGLPVVLLVVLYGWLSGRLQGMGGGGTRRSRRAQRLWSRYGMPGLALLAPLTTGVHLAALAGLALGSPRREVVWWLLGSVAVWSIAVTVLTVAGFEGFRRLTG